MKKITLITTVFVIFFSQFYFVQASECLNCVAIYGDSHDNDLVHKEICDAIAKFQPVVVFHAGDLVANTLDQHDWDNFNAATSLMREKAEFYPVFGNRETEPEVFFKQFPHLKNKHYYTVQRSGIYFILLDSNLNFKKGSLQYRWLESELENARLSAKPVIVVLHHPVFSAGEGYLENNGLKDSLLSLFEKYKVKAVFSGHEHNYQRFFHNNVYYIITGGGGAPFTGKLFVGDKDNQKFIKAHHFCMLSVMGNQLKVDVYSPDLKVLDSFTVSLQP
ncbi:MAG: metallophosphoesterase [Candidatus Omnitrophica bacterium]|nr:metallophosphoesterase [Candidatus Omnitrophota bacterium]